MTAVSGVRRSCEMFARNCVFSASRASRSPMCCRACLSCASSAITRPSVVGGCVRLAGADASARCMERSLPGGVPTSSANRHCLGDLCHAVLFLDGFLELLTQQQGGVAPARRDERGVRAALDDASL